MNIALIATLLTLIAVALLVIGIRRPQQDGLIEERLAQFGNRVPTLEELELQQPFRDRVFKPFMRNLTLRLGRLAPSQNTARLRQQLAEAGNPRGLGPTEFMGLRVVIGGGFGGFLLLVLLVSGQSMLQVVMFSAIVGVIGYMLPGVWLSRLIKDRKTEAIRALPDAIDLLTISVEAGLGFDPALVRVVEKWDNVLTREFGRMLSELRMGVSRRDALRDVAARLNVDDLNVFVSAVVQADQLGVSISQVLRIQSKQMRMRRRQRAEEKAQKAPLKLLFPMVFLIFPSIYVVILGPAIPRIIAGLRG